MNVRLWFFSSGFCVVLILRLAPLAESGVQSFIAGVAANEFWRKYVNDPMDARFTKNFGAELKVTMGDVVVTSVFPTSKTVMRPWHWFYTLWPAMAGPEGKPNIPAKMIRFLPTRKTLFVSVSPQLFNPAIKYQTRVLMNREKKAGHIGLVGVLIAYMMGQNQKLYFNPFFCSAKHYVEYLALGQVTGGRWWQPLYNRLSKRCPVRNLVTSEMLDEIYMSRTFTLRGKLDDAKVTLRVDKWPEEIELMYHKHKKREEAAGKLKGL